MFYLHERNRRQLKGVESRRFCDELSKMFSCLCIKITFLENCVYNIFAQKRSTTLLPTKHLSDVIRSRECLQVDEVFDAVQDAELRDKLRSVCLTDGRCYMTFTDAEYLERALHTALRIRDVSVLLMDTGAGAVILSLTGVPDTVADKDVLKCLKKYGTIIGGYNNAKRLFFFSLFTYFLSTFSEKSYVCGTNPI